jgi:hypothetical protein
MESCRADDGAPWGVRRGHATRWSPVRSCFAEIAMTATRGAVSSAWLEETVFGPARRDAERIAQVGVRLETERAAARDDRGERCTGVIPVLAANEEPGSSSDDLAAEVEFAHRRDVRAPQCRSLAHERWRERAA